jgi:hypothetical protein
MVAYVIELVGRDHRAARDPRRLDSNWTRVRRPVTTYANIGLRRRRREHDPQDRTARHSAIAILDPRTHGTRRANAAPAAIPLSDTRPQVTRLSGAYPGDNTPDGNEFGASDLSGV